MTAKALHKYIPPNHALAAARLSMSLLAVGIAGCEAPPPARPEPPKLTVNFDLTDESEAATPESTEQDDAWAAMEHMLDAGTTPLPSAGQPPRTNAAPVDTRPYHALVLQTFQDDVDGQAASLWREQLGLLVPPLDPDLGVHTDNKGSLVVYGHYEGWNDPKAAEDMASLKSLRIDNKRVFGPIIRTTIRPQRKPEEIHPYELLSLRLRYPDARTIYTLEIEVWGDFDSGTLPDAVRRANAESRVAQLRADRTPAFFHHDPVSRLSMVTVGAFNEQALDPESGLTSVEVEQWQRKFPNHLTNGEKLSLPVQGRPDLGVIPHRSRLVLVPEL